MTDEEKNELRKLMDQEQSEGAIRDCILKYQQVMMEDAMKLRGIYLAYINVGFNSYEALTLVMKSIK